MSRHRHVRNINIHDELDDDALSDGGEHDMSPEQQAQMDAGLESVRAIIGNLETSGLSDATLKDVLWEYYFDIGRTIQWAIDEQERRRRAEERKEDDKGLPPLPQDAEETPIYHQYPQPWLQFGEERPRVPLILLAQQQQQLMEEQRAHQEYMQEQDAQEEESIPSDYAQYPPARRPLTPITEERTSKMSLNRSSTLTSYGRTIAAKEREKIQKKADKSNVTSPSSSRASSVLSTPVKPAKKLSALSSGASTPTRKTSVDQRQLDLSSLNLDLRDDQLAPVSEEPLPIVYAKEKLIEEVKKSLEKEGKGKRRGISLVVIGHVDAGKSTLMGRLLYELGRLDEKTRVSNERASGKLGKSSFSWAWSFDGTAEERERGITMDIGQQSLSTKNRDITILDAPGHRDFIPNMISGASQADCALLVVDAAVGEFEAGFQRGGQTREHLLLVRSLGVTQLIIAVNKLDQVQWEQGRYNEICAALRPFLTQSGYSMSKASFVPVGAMQGVNLASRDSSEAMELRKWYQGPTLVDLIDKLEPPARDITGPLRIPISNVYKSQGSSMAASGRICSGVVQVGEKLRVLPGDETAIVRSIDTEQTNAPWAAAGTNVTLYLTAIDPIHLNVGSVLCSPSALVPLVTTFTARVIVFDIQVPITAGASVEMFHHSRDLPATVSKLLTILDRATGTVTKTNPRVLGKGMSAEVEISLRTASMSGAGSGVRAIPIETFSANKEMGRVLLRRGGETIAAGIILKLAN